MSLEPTKTRAGCPETGRANPGDQSRGLKEQGAAGAVVVAAGLLLSTVLFAIVDFRAAAGAPDPADASRVAELGLNRSCWTHSVPYRDQDGRPWLDGDATCSDFYGDGGRFVHAVRTKGGLVVNLTYFANAARAAVRPPDQVELFQRAVGRAQLPVARVVEAGGPPSPP